MRKLTKSEQIVLDMFKDFQKKGIYVVINLADNGGIRYIEPILPSYKKVIGYNGKNGYKSSCKVPQYEIQDVFLFNGKEYSLELSIDVNANPGTRRVTPTIIKNLTFLGLLKPLPAFVSQVTGNREDPDMVSCGYLTFEADYFFVPFELTNHENN